MRNHKQKSLNQNLSPNNDSPIQLFSKEVQNSISASKINENTEFVFHKTLVSDHCAPGDGTVFVSLNACDSSAAVGTVQSFGGLRNGLEMKYSGEDNFSARHSLELN